MRSTRLALALLATTVLGVALVGADAAAANGDAEAYCRKRYLAAPVDRDERAGGLLQKSAPAGRSFAPSATGHLTLQGGPPTPAPAAEAAADVLPPPGPDRDRYPEADPNPIKRVAETPVSTFSADVDTASYAVVRRYLADRGRMPPADAVRPEELVNAFDYAYPAPDRPEAGFLPDVAVFPAPWNPERRLLRIGVKGYAVDPENRPPANLVFLLDVSGSMRSADKLPLAKTAICMLTHELNPDDRIALVVYAGAAGVVLEPTPAARKSEILEAMDALEAGGSTAGGAGVELAYALAEAHFRAGAANRILLATDGDFNVGVADPRQLRDYVARKRRSGVFLTVLGFGMGNYSDVMMQSLSQAGNGVAAYIDSVEEAHKVLVRGLTASIITIAKDVKFQVEFNPARVAEYRLIGYETRLLDRADFNNDRVDAGDVGAGHTVTALYEIALAGAPGQAVDPLRYGARPEVPADVAGEIAVARLRFKTPESEESRLIERPVTDADAVDDVAAAPTDARFAAAVAWFAEALRQSPHVPADWAAIRSLADGARGSDAYADRRRFVGLVETAEKVAALD